MNMNENIETENKSESVRSSKNVNSEELDDLITLYVWPGEWEASSLDANCLTVMVTVIYFIFQSNQIEIL
jgi:hypothetical protein